MIQSIPTNSGVAPGGAVGGASNLTTVGAIPYVSSAGVLNQDATKLFWDATNDRLGVGTASPTNLLEVVNGIHQYAFQPVASNGFVINNNGFTFSMASSSTLASLTTNVAAIAFLPAGTERARFAPTTGNLLIGGTTDGGYRFGVQSSGTTGTVRIFDQTATTGSTLAVIQAGAGQSGSLLSVRNNAGTEVAGFGSTYWNLFASGTTDNLFGASLSGNFAYLGGNSTAITLFLLNSTPLKWSPNGATGSTDLGLARNAAGILEINNGTAGTYRDLYTRSQILYGAGTGVKTLQVRGNSSNDAIIQEWQNNAGTTLASISSAGVAAFAGVSAGSLSTTGSALVGAAGLYYWTGRSAMSSSSDGIIVFANNAGTNFDRLIFGVGNSSFPSLKRSGSALEVRLADDSAYAALQAVRLQTAAQTVSQLPAAAAGNAGSIQYVTDANATTIGSTVAGGGSNKVMVWSDGTNWKIYAS